MNQIEPNSICPGARKGGATGSILPHSVFNPGAFFYPLVAQSRVFGLVGNGLRRQKIQPSELAGGPTSLTISVERLAMQRGERGCTLEAGSPRNQTGGCERLEPEWTAPYPGL